MAQHKGDLPETPEELTADWLSKVLNKPIDSVTQTVLGEGIGFMGDVLLLQTQTPEGGGEKIVAKLPKKANRVMGELLGVYEREIMFFQEFGDRVPLRIPKVYYSEFDRDKGSEKQGEILAQVDRLPLFMSKAISYLGNVIAASKKRRYMLLIEYLQDMEPGDQLVGIGVDRCKQVLCEVAALHAQYWNSADVQRHFWLLDLDLDAKLRHGLFTQHVDSFARTGPAGLHAALKWLRPNGVALTRQFVARAPKTLLHCDLRLDNVMFDGERCAFIDWQLVRTGPAAFDVAYFISSALHVNASSQDVLSILTSYHDTLGISDYPFDQFYLDYQRGLMMVVSNLSSVEEVQLGDGRGQTMMNGWFERLAARVQDVNLETLL